jgi:hypothetical protein
MLMAGDSVFTMSILLGVWGTAQVESIVCSIGSHSW